MDVKDSNVIIFEGGRSRDPKQNSHKRRSDINVFPGIHFLKHTIAASVSSV
jgi:hypothetical protein